MWLYEKDSDGTSGRYRPDVASIGPITTSFWHINVMIYSMNSKLMACCMILFFFFLLATVNISIY